MRGPREWLGKRLAVAENLAGVDMTQLASDLHEANVAILADKLALLAVGGDDLVRCHGLGCCSVGVHPFDVQTLPRLPV